MKQKYFLAAVSLLFAINVSAQKKHVANTPAYDTAYVNDNYCRILVELTEDASRGFVKAKGKELETNATTAIWTSNIGIPGALTSSLLFVDKWRYEGVMYQGVSIDDMRIYYTKYKKLLDDCLRMTGYDLKEEKNLAPKLDRYPEQVYTKPSGQVPRITMKVESAGSTGVYTLTVNVWQQAN